MRIHFERIQWKIFYKQANIKTLYENRVTLTLRPHDVVKSPCDIALHSTEICPKILKSCMISYKYCATLRRVLTVLWEQCANAFWHHSNPSQIAPHNRPKPPNCMENPKNCAKIAQNHERKKIMQILCDTAYSWSINCEKSLNIPRCHVSIIRCH